jgi:hypothetical protein
MYGPAGALESKSPTWGGAGARANAGRKPNGHKAGVSHLRRPDLYSIQGNHLHLIVEAECKESLARGMKGLSFQSG